MGSGCGCSPTRKGQDMNKRRLYIIVTVLLLAGLAGVGVACRKNEISAQGYRYGRYGPIHVLGKLWVDSDANLDGAVTIDGGLTNIGGGSCSVADGDNDVCIAAVLEVDGELELDGALDADSTANIADTLTLSKATGNGLVVTSNIDANGDLDVDGTTNLDVVDIDGAVDFGGQELDLDADNDTSITADTDDQIDIEIAGADDFQFTANTFTALAGSAIDTNALDDTSGGEIAVTAGLDLTGLMQWSFADLAVSDGDTITPTVTVYSLDTSGAVTVTLAASADEGQLLVLINDDANATIIADTNLRSSDGNAITLAGAYDIAVFIYQDSEWLELLNIANS